MKKWSKKALKELAEIRWLKIRSEGEPHEEDRRAAHKELIARTSNHRRNRILQLLREAHGLAGKLAYHQGPSLYTMLPAIIRTFENGLSVEDLKELEYVIHGQVREAENNRAQSTYEIFRNRWSPRQSS